MGSRNLGLAFLMLLGAGSVHGANSSEQRKHPRGGLTLERFKKISGIQSRKISISPDKNVKGIETGIVMAYGHIIPPPYHVEYVGNHLLVNGVQVEPSLVKERHRRQRPVRKLSPEKAAKQRKSGEIIQSAQSLYESEKKSSSADVARKKATELLLKHSDEIQNLIWHGEELCYTTPAYAFSQCVNWGAAKILNPANWAKNEAESKTLTVSTMERELRNGNWLCFGSTGGWTARKDMRSQVRAIMADSNLQGEQKVEALKERVFGNYTLALDVVENYDATEWVSGK